MDEKERQVAFMSALTTEHFVQQTASSAAVGEATARTSIYIFSLSSSLVAMGFATQSRDAFVPFVATILPTLFLLGCFTIVRLVDVNLENMQFLTNIARIRSYYRTLTPEAATYFAAENGRWPEMRTPPALRLGTLVAFLTTAASMVALINSIVAGAGVAFLLGQTLGSGRTGIAVSVGVAAAVMAMVGFLLFQRWRYRGVGSDGQRDDHQHGDRRTE
jgi:hypothetical protein